MNVLKKKMVKFQKMKQKGNSRTNWKTNQNNDSEDIQNCENWMEEIKNDQKVKNKIINEIQNAQEEINNRITCRRLDNRPGR